MWSKPSLSALLPPDRRDFLAALMVVLGFTSLAVALADPYLLRITENPQFRRKNLVFLLDASPSMNTQDVWPSRIERAKEVIHRFIQRETEVVRFGLVSFSESSVILSYLTSDPQNLLFHLDFLCPDRRILYGTDIGVALSSGLQVLEKQEQREESDRLRPETGSLLVLLSDGEDHGESLETAIQEAARRGIRVHTVGVGTSLIFFLSDFISLEQMFENPQMGYLARHHDLIPVVIEDPLERAIPELPGLHLLEDSESGHRRMSYWSKENVNKYQREIERRRQSLTSMFYSMDLDSLWIDAGDENFVDRLLEHFLRRRRLS